jgi:hypothetical protein
MSREAADGAVTELRRRGYAVLPMPRRVGLGPGSVKLDAAWHVQAENVGEGDVAVRTLVDRLREEHGLALAAGPGGAKRLRLAIRPGAVETHTADDRQGQAYSLRIAADAIEVTGNATAGLFYGVQTLLQLSDGDGRQALLLPEAAIADWPEYQLRFVHWDTKHHQDRPETLRRHLDWMARFKLNAVSFELEDKFEYPSHPVIGAPGAFTTAELRALVRYGLERHIQIVPNVQAPAHMAYVLKHPEFAHLRCDGSNYQICMDEPEARRLIFDMYDDACRATEGVEYFHVSTDEVYYAGICEKFRRPYDPANRSLTWVDFVLAAHAHLAARGRRVILWAEFPLLAEHVGLLPLDVIDGILSPEKESAMVRAADARGIRQLAYAPMQGEEPLFPNYFEYAERDGAERPGRLAEALRTTLRPSPHGGRPIGTFAAAWDDAGLHSETFWLGWATMAQGGWTPGAASLDETIDTFMNIYYLCRAARLKDIYRRMQAQARFWEFAWERVPSKVRGPAYGWSRKKSPAARTDLTLLPPALPRMPDLTVEPVYRTRYAALAAEAAARRLESDRLLADLCHARREVGRNRYNLEVFHSVADLVRHFIETIQAVGRAEEWLAEAAAADRARDRRRALAWLCNARHMVGGAMGRGRETYANLVKVWEKDRYPRNAPAGGKEFLHAMDDVKDHFADRRPDLSYHTAPLESIGLDRWCDAMGEIIRAYARMHGLGEK